MPDDRDDVIRIFEPPGAAPADDALPLEVDDSLPIDVGDLLRLVCPLFEGLASAGIGELHLVEQAGGGYGLGFRPRPLGIARPGAPEPALAALEASPPGMIEALRDRIASLESIVDRANRALERIDYAPLSFRLGAIGAISDEAFRVTWEAGQALNFVIDARAILGEMDGRDADE